MGGELYILGGHTTRLGGTALWLEVASLYKGSLHGGLVSNGIQGRGLGRGSGGPSPPEAENILEEYHTVREIWCIDNVLK
jgi:hypothetical protein